MTFLQLAEEILKKTRTPLSSGDIWRIAEEKSLSHKVATRGRTPWQTINAQLYMDIKANPNSRFKQVTKRPARFGLSEIEYSDNELDLDNYTNNQVQETESGSSNSKKKSLRESDLHILLSTFLRSNSHFKCYAKTISDKKSKKKTKGHNQWLHPDMVGTYFPFEEYQERTLQLLETLKNNPYKLFSFEIKIKVNFTNLRESYFQAVSNSSWADEGYLVALEIKDEPDLMDELRRLNNAFGIGVIRLNAENIEQSEILFAAKPHDTLDWSTINRLVEENVDFQNWLGHIIDDVKVGKVRGRYDSILDEADRIDYMKKHNIPYVLSIE